MPKNIAQWTGFTVTIIIVLGRDADVLTAVPLGIAAGMLTALFQKAIPTERQPVRPAAAPVPFALHRPDFHRPLIAMLRLCAASSLKRLTVGR